MNGLLLVFSVFVTFTACGIMRRDYCRKDVASPSDLYLFNAATSISSVIMLALIGAFTKTLSAASPYTLLLGALFGVISALCAMCDMKALETGPFSYTSIIVSCSMVIPAFSGLLFFQESVTPFQYAGAFFMIFAFVFAVDPKFDTSGTSLKWFLFCIGSFLLNGAIGVMQKVHQSSDFKSELSAFLIVAFLISCVFSLTLAMLNRKKHPLTSVRPAKLKRFLVYGVCCGAGIALANQINMHLSGVMPSIIFFPVVNGGYMLLTSAAGLLLFREKLSKKQLIGMIAGACAILLLCIQPQA